MIKHILTKAILLITFSLASTFMSGQDQVTIGDTNLSIPFDVTECSSINTGMSIEFLRSLNCGGNILVSKDNVQDTTTSGVSLMYSFADPGQYIVFCGASPISAATAKACYTVTVPQTVPTMGEWGLISLSLLLLITMVVAFKSELIGNNKVA